MKEVAQKSAIAFALKIVGVALAFGFNLVLARLLGAEGVGVYSLAFTIITIAAIVGRFGLDGAVTRFVAARASESDWSGVKGVVRNALCLTLLMSLLLVLVIVVSAGWLAESVFKEESLVEPLRYMALAIVPFSFLTLYARGLQGLKDVRDSLLMQSVLIPFLGCIGLFILVPYLGVSGATITYGLSTLVALLYGVYRWNKRVERYRHEKPDFPVNKLLKSGFPLLGGMLLQQLMVSIPVLVLGVWSSTEEVGFYSIAQRTASLIGLVLIAANSIIAPKFSALYQQKDMVALDRVARQAALILTLMATPIALILLIAPKWVMTFFGPEFANAWLFLVILACGRLVGVMSGSVGILLVMTGNERTYFVANLQSVLLCGFLCLLLIPTWGGLGGAIAASVSLAAVNLLRVRYVWKSTGIMTLPIPSFMWSRGKVERDG
ncbi:flippase [Porticoccus sp.]